MWGSVAQLGEDLELESELGIEHDLRTVSLMPRSIERGNPGMPLAPGM